MISTPMKFGEVMWPQHQQKPLKVMVKNYLHILIILCFSLIVISCAEEEEVPGGVTSPDHGAYQIGEPLTDLHGYDSLGR